MRISSATAAVRSKERLASRWKRVCTGPRGYFTRDLRVSLGTSKTWAPFLGRGLGCCLRRPNGIMMHGHQFVQQFCPDRSAEYDTGALHRAVKLVVGETHR